MGKRFDVRLSSRGYLTCVPAGSSLNERYENWQVILKVNRPLTKALKNEAYQWAIYRFNL